MLEDLNMFCVSPLGIKDKDVVSSHTHDDNDNKQMQGAEVFNAKHRLVNDERNRYAHDDLDHARRSQEQTLQVIAQVNPYRRCNKHCDLLIVRNCVFFDLDEEAFVDCFHDQQF